MAFELDRKKLYIGGGVFAFLIVVIIIVWASSSESKLVADYANFRMTIKNDDEEILIESYVKGEDRYLKGNSSIDGRTGPIYMVNKVVWELKDDQTCNRLADDEKFTNVDEIQEKVLDVAKKVNLDKTDGTKTATIDDEKVTVTKKDNVFTQIVIDGDDGKVTFDLNIKPPASIFKLPAVCK